MSNDAASTFVVTAICDFGDTDEKKIAAVQAVLDAAGFDARATCWPVFGGIWRAPCTGPDSADATRWLAHLTDTMVRGKAEIEIKHVRDAIEERQTAAVT